MIATSIEQSRHLAELIPHDSADMTYERFAIGNVPEELQYRLCLTAFKFYSGIGIPAWSLSALLSLISYPTLSQQYTGLWNCMEFPQDGEVFNCKDPIEAAYKMVCWLKENEKI